MGQFSEERHSRLRIKQLICSSLNWNQTVLAAAIHIPDRNAGPLEGAVAGSWSLGIVERSQGEGCRGDVKEEVVVGNVCGEKLGSHGSMVIPLSHVLGVEPPP